MKLKTDLQSLLQPNFDGLTQEERLLRAVMLAYVKHADPDSQSANEIGWNRLGDILCDEICNTLGDAEFVKWKETLH